VREVVEFLEKEGYRVQKVPFLRGKSGTEHQFDIYATKGEANAQKLIGTVAATSTEVGINDVLRLYAAAMDVGVRNVLLVALPKLTDEAKNLAKFYQILIVEGQDMKQVSERLPDLKIALSHRSK
jgi:hypothetical protein